MKYFIRFKKNNEKLVRSLECNKETDTIWALNRIAEQHQKAIRKAQQIIRDLEGGYVEIK